MPKAKEKSSKPPTPGRYHHDTSYTSDEDPPLAHSNQAKVDSVPSTVAEDPVEDPASPQVHSLEAAMLRTLKDFRPEDSDEPAQLTKGFQYAIISLVTDHMEEKRRKARYSIKYNILYFVLDC